MLSQRALLTLQSNEVFWAEMVLSVDGCGVLVGGFNCGVPFEQGIGECPCFGLWALDRWSRTHCLVFLQTLVMSPAQLRPLCELVLRAGAVHFTLELDHFALHALLLALVAGS